MFPNAHQPSEPSLAADTPSVLQSGRGSGVIGALRRPASLRLASPTRCAAVASSRKVLLVGTQRRTKRSSDSTWLLRLSPCRHHSQKCSQLLLRTR